MPGTAPSALLVDDLMLATALCFDVAYDDVLREQVAQGAQLASSRPATPCSWEPPSSSGGCSPEPAPSSWAARSSSHR